MRLPQTFLFFIGLFLWLSLGNSFAAEIRVSSDRNPIKLNESFQLVFSADESPDDDPDFSVLEQDFEIVSQASGSEVSVVNGAVTKKMTWTLSLMAKRSGNLTIPAVAFGDDRSPSLSLGVNALNQGSTDALSDEPIFLKVSVSPKTVYVQSQLIYKLQLYRRVGVTQATLSEPELADAVIEKLGDDKNYTTEQNGQQYSVTERSYAIFPQKSGELTIAPIQLVAEIVTDSRQKFNGFFSRQMTRRQRVSSEAVTLNVLPIPSELSGKPWFPAAIVQLQEQWSIDKQQVPVGEPITRTLSLFAKGAMPSQLPEFDGKLALQNIKTYPDKAVLKQSLSAEGVISVREEKTAIIPETAGTYQLPAIEVPWWNTTTKRLEVARLPATTIIAVSNADSTLTMPTAMMDKTPVVVDSKASLVWMALAGFFALAWLLTLLYFLRKKPKTVKSVAMVEKTIDLKGLKKACLANNPQVAKDALIDWGREQYQLSNLGQIAERCHPALTEEINRLNQHLYAATTDDWQGEALWKAFNDKSLEKIKQLSDDKLEALHSID